MVAILPPELGVPVHATPVIATANANLRAPMVRSLPRSGSPPNTKISSEAPWLAAASSAASCCSTACPRQAVHSSQVPPTPERSSTWLPTLWPPHRVPRRSPIVPLQHHGAPPACHLQLSLL